MTANADSRYQMLLHVAAPIRRRSATAELKSTYTASVSAVEASTPAATRGSSLIIFSDHLRDRLLRSHRSLSLVVCARRRYRSFRSPTPGAPKSWRADF